MAKSQNFKHLLVRKLKNKGIIGGAHKPEESFLRFLRKHPNRESVLKDYNELIKEKVIIRGKKNKGIHISLTSKKKRYMPYLQ